MNQYVTGAFIKKLREEKKMTQAELAESLGVSDKTISKWETGKGYPDITLIEPIAKTLGVSVVELFSGEHIRNLNRSFNMSRLKFYVCPICGNIITASGEGVISCCGIVLPPLEAEMPDEKHMLSVDVVEDEYYVSVNHEMTKGHYISFIASVSGDTVQMKKLYPEGSADARFKINRTSAFYYYCNHHGLYKMVRK
ncbi:MAG TPA: helix-turn-helix domain-containing protein [Clostridiales bacterium]|nr:helix-turn-helix domain-containing protein [Clostridiales bacterium]